MRALSTMLNSPLSGFSKPITIFSKVVFPAPLGPNSKMRASEAIVKFTLSSIQVSSQHFVIRAANLTKCWDETCILDNVNFTIASDARILLFGPNGAGKTTLLKIVMGFEKPDKGELSIVESARIGYLPQDPQMDLDKTVIETYRY